MKNTTQFAQFDKTTLKALRAEMQEVLNKYAVSANLDVSVGNMSYSVGAKIKGAVTMTDRILEGEVTRYGLKMKNSAGDTITGYNTRAGKYPFQYTCGSTGNRYKCSTVQAKLKFGM